MTFSRNDKKVLRENGFEILQRKKGRTKLQWALFRRQVGVEGEDDPRNLDVRLRKKYHRGRDQWYWETAMTGSRDEKFDLLEEAIKYSTDLVATLIANQLFAGTPVFRPNQTIPTPESLLRAAAAVKALKEMVDAYAFPDTLAPTHDSRYPLKFRMK